MPKVGNLLVKFFGADIVVTEVSGTNQLLCYPNFYSNFHTTHTHSFGSNALQKCLAPEVTLGIRKPGGRPGLRGKQDEEIGLPAQMRVVRLFICLTV